MNYYAEIAGIPADIIYNLEEAMFCLIKYKLYVKDEDYQNYYYFFAKTSDNNDDKSINSKK